MSDWSGLLLTSAIQVHDGSKTGKIDALKENKKQKQKSYGCDDIEPASGDILEESPQRDKQEEKKHEEHQYAPVTEHCTMLSREETTRDESENEQSKLGNVLLRLLEHAEKSNKGEFKAKVTLSGHVDLYAEFDLPEDYEFDCYPSAGDSVELQYSSNTSVEGYVIWYEKDERCGNLMLRHRRADFPDVERGVMVRFHQRNFRLLRMREAIENFVADKSNAHKPISDFLLGVGDIHMETEETFSYNSIMPHCDHLYRWIANDASCCKVHFMSKMFRCCRGDSISNKAKFFKKVVEKPIRLLQVPDLELHLLCAGLLSYMVQQGSKVLVCGSRTYDADFLAESMEELHLQVVSVRGGIWDLPCYDSRCMTLDEKVEKLKRQSDPECAKQEILEKANVVCSSCYGAGDGSLKDIQFDQVLFVAECIEVPDYEWVIPLLKGKKVILAVSDFVADDFENKFSMGGEDGDLLPPSLHTLFRIRGEKPMKLSTEERWALMIEGESDSEEEGW